MCPTIISFQRNICQLLGNITKHSADLATQVMNKINPLQKLLNCLKDSDDIVKKNDIYLKDGDVFSIRRIGKFRYNGIIKNTKKGGFIISIYKYI